MFLWGGRRRIRQMINSLQALSRGDLQQKIYSQSSDELGRLAEATNLLVEQLKAKIAMLESQHTQVQAMLSSMAEGVIAVDQQTRIVSMNPTVENIFGVSKAQAEGAFFLEAIRNNDLAEIISLVMRQGESVSRELNLVWPVQKVFQVNASPIFERAVVNGCLLVIHDITEIRRLEKVRADFIANVSHEFKTPLTSIKGFVETLLEGALDDKEHSRQFLQIIHEHTERLNNLINDLLELSCLESKEIVLHKEEVVMRPLVDKVLLGFETQLRKRRIEPANDIPPEAVVQADRDKIEQVVTNLIDNAIKFNRENGRLRISATLLPKEIKIIVEDSGVGIPEKALSRIFERFYRVDKARSRQLGGTGLGLSIVKHSIELHGGKVGVESVEGQGSTFWFSVPA